MWLLWADITILIFSAGVVAVAVEAFTEIITSSELAAWIRTPLTRLALPPADASLRWYWLYLYKLMTCGYCFSVIAALLFAWSLPGAWWGLLPWDNIVVKWLLLHRLANWWHVGFTLFSRGRIVPQEMTLRIAKESTADHATILNQSDLP